MVFGKRKKFINIMSKNFFIFWVILKSHVMMIALVINFSAIGIAIAAPSSIKEPAAIPWYERAKFCDGNLQLGEDRLQSWSDSGRYAGPFNRQRIKARESFKNRAAEFCRSCAPSVQFVDIEQSPNTKNTDNYTGNAGKDCKVIPWQWRVLPFVALIPIILYLIDALLNKDKCDKVP